ncbi:GTPase [Streptosporangium longisporum]
MFLPGAQDERPHADAAPPLRAGRPREEPEQDGPDQGRPEQDENATPGEGSGLSEGAEEASRQGRSVGPETAGPETAAPEIGGPETDGSGSGSGQPGLDEPGAGEPRSGEPEFDGSVDQRSGGSENEHSDDAGDERSTDDRSAGERSGDAARGDVETSNADGVENDSADIPPSRDKVTPPHEHEIVEIRDDVRDDSGTGVVDGELRDAEHESTESRSGERPAGTGEQVPDGADGADDTTGGGTDDEVRADTGAEGEDAAGSATSEDDGADVASPEADGPTETGTPADTGTDASTETGTTPADTDTGTETGTPADTSDHPESEPSAPDPSDSEASDHEASGDGDGDHESGDAEAEDRGDKARDAEDAEPQERVRETPLPAAVSKALSSALTAVRIGVTDLTFGLDLPGAEEARKVQGEILAQLDDYVIPRVHTSTAPALIVVAGSTGAGKSTLLNTLANAKVSATGVRRPTTGTPVLACHPDDHEWFAKGELLGGLRRLGEPDPEVSSGGLVLVSTEHLPAGVALLDTPDIDSVVEEHHEIAHRMLDVADLWIFVTTAARYADAPAWRLLRLAKERGARLAIVLSRVPPQVPGSDRQALREDAHRVRSRRGRPVRRPREQGRRRDAPRRRGDRAPALAGRALGRRAPPRTGREGHPERGAQQLPYPDTGPGQAAGGPGRPAQGPARGRRHRLRPRAGRDRREDRQRLTAPGGGAGPLAGLRRFR